MADITELAPTLIAAGVDPDDLAHMLRPKDKPVPPPIPDVPPKRYRMVLERLVSGEGIEEAARNACVPVEAAQAVADEIEAVTDALSSLEPVPAEMRKEDDAEVAVFVGKDPVKPIDPISPVGPRKARP